MESSTGSRVSHRSLAPRLPRPVPSRSPIYRLVKSGSVPAALTSTGSTPITPTSVGSTTAPTHTTGATPPPVGEPASTGLTSDVEMMSLNSASTDTTAAPVASGDVTPPDYTDANTLVADNAGEAWVPQSPNTPLSNEDVEMTSQKMNLCCHD